MKAPSKHLYRFNGIELDPAQGCLRRNGEELYPRQKSLRALQYLLEQRHRLVSKDELIGHVWEGMAVTDDALVQLVKELRRYLGDDHRRPGFIKTVPKAGYRFIAPVEEVLYEPQAIIEIERRSSIEIEYEEEYGGVEEGREPRRGAEKIIEGVVPTALEITRSPAHSVPRSRGLLFRASLIVVGACVFVGTGLLASNLKGRREDSSPMDVSIPQIPGKRPLAVMFFENQSGNTNMDWLREGLADMLITDLSRSSNLSVLSRQQLHLQMERVGYDSTARLRLDEATEVARRSRADVFVLGSFSQLDEKIRVEAQVYDAQRGQPLVVEQFVAERPDQILGLMHLLSLKLAVRLGATPSEQERRDSLADVMTNNLEAYRYYSLGLEKAQGLQNSEAIALFQKAIALDPEFAMAHARIGYTYVISMGLSEKGKPHLERAFKLSERLSEKDRLHIKAWYAIANADYNGAINVFRDLIAANPMEAEAFDRLSRLLMGEDRIEEALEVGLRGLVIDPESKDLLNHTSEYYSLLGRHEEAIATCQRFVTLAPNEPNAYDSMGLRYQWAGRYAEAVAAYQHALEIDRTFEIARMHLGNAYFQQGRYRDALAQYRLFIENATQESERARGYGCIAHVYWKRGDFEQMARAADMQIRIVRTSADYALIAAVQREDFAQAEKFVQQMAGNGLKNNRGLRLTGRFYYYLSGYEALKRGSKTEALEDFRETLRHYPMVWSIDSFEDCLARGYFELGEFDEAIREYERIIRLNPNYPLAHYYLAEAYNRQGKRDQAQAEYRRFLESWQQADDDVPEVVAARKQLAS